MTLRDTLRLGPALPFKAAEILTVTGLSADLREVIVSDQTGSDRPVPCMASYHSRAVGDVVLGVQLAGGSWLIMGRIGEDDTPDAGPSTVISATLSAGWLNGTAVTSVDPRAGAEASGTPDWLGAWFYSGQIAAACSGRTVTRMQVRVSRTSWGGVDGPALLRLGLHSSSGVQPALTSTWVPGVSLPRGGSAQVTIPTPQATALASGASLGVGVWGTGPAEFAVFTTSADISITFG